MAEPAALARVGINATALLTPLTGIGQYTLQLARAMGALLPQPPWLFYGGPWEREVRVPPPLPQDGVAARVKRAVPFGFEAARFLQQRRFTAGARAHGLALYHEPNFLAFRFAGPTVVTVHDLSWVRFPEMHPAERVRVMEGAMPKVVKDAAQIVVDSEFVRGEVIAHYGVAPERVTTALLGVPPGFRVHGEEECAAVLAAHGLEFGCYLLAVGTLEPRKNLAAVVAAYARLPDAMRRRHPLVVVGMQGWGMDRLPGPMRRMMDAGEVRLLGYLPQEDLPKVYAGARLFAYPSVYEGFGLPPLEAMASGVPVIVSQRASLPEVVGDAGLLVEPADDVEIAARMREVIEDAPLHQRLREAGLRRAARFTWQDCAQRTLEVYRKALASA